MMPELESIRESFLREAGGDRSPEYLEELRVRYLGRNGAVTQILRTLKDLPLDQKQHLGPKVQALQREIETTIEAKRAELLPLLKYDVDLTAPGKRPRRGHLHLLTIADREIRQIFASMNFSLVESNEIESEYYNFDALNFPLGHPARDVQDTFWLEQPEKEQRNPKTHLLLRTQVTAMQLHHLESHTPPFQILYPGRTFRNEASDAGHEMNFYQSEGMVVGKNITLTNFKSVIEAFLKKFFGEKVRFRYRASYFPFTEPSVEVDIYYNGKWFEVMGAGMVHQHVFEYAHYNPGEWQGFAFGMGLDRLTMIKYNIPDIRLFYSGDLRFIRQF